jgi:hypothetical protein
MSGKALIVHGNTQAALLLASSPASHRQAI